MTDATRFKAAFAMLATAFNREVTRGLAHVYWRALADLTDDEFERACTVAIASERFWPAPVTLRGLARPEPDHDEAAGVAFDAIEGLGTYTPHGYRWDPVVIGDRLGDAARRAFLAIGGSEAWRTFSYQYRRKDFISVYRDVAQVLVHEERLRLVMAPQPARLPGGAT